MAVDLLPLLGNIDKSPGAARAAALAAQAYTDRARGKWGNPDPMLEEESEVSDARAIHIFNVGPWNDWARLGSGGDVFRPAKPDGQRYVYCCTVPGIYLEHGLNGEGEVQSKHIKGLLVAQNIIGEGDMLRGHNDDNRAKNGVFISSVRGMKNRTPTEEDLARAEARLIARFHELVDEANDARALGGPNAVLSINEKHHLAAKRINRMDLDWARDKNPQVSFRCQQCNRPCVETATRCECGFILKPAEFWAQVQQGQIIIPGVQVSEMYRLSAVRVDPEQAAAPAAAAPAAAAPKAGPIAPPVKPPKEKVDLTQF